MKTLILVGCSAGKLETAAPAEELYTGDLHKLARRYAQLVCLGAEWGILSAKFGVLRSWEVLEPYDATLGTVKARRAWDELVLAQLQNREHPTPAHHFATADREPVRVIVLAGENYRGWISDAPLRWEVVVPLQGLGIGQQKAALGRMIDSLERTKHEHPAPDLDERVFRSLAAMTGGKLDL